MKEAPSNHLDEVMYAKALLGYESRRSWPNGEGLKAAIFRWRSGGHKMVGGKKCADMTEEERVADGEDKICLII